MSKETKIHVLKSDRLEEFPRQAHVILANPPYIKREADGPSVHPSVILHEPPQAIFLDDALYLSWYDHFFREVHKHLMADGLFLMEGHEQHLEELEGLLRPYSFSSIEIKDDLTGRKRFLKAHK